MTVALALLRPDAQRLAVDVDDPGAFADRFDFVFDLERDFFFLDDRHERIVSPPIVARCASCHTCRVLRGRATAGRRIYCSLMSSYIRQDEPVLIWTGRSMLDGVVTIPRDADALVVMPGLSNTFHHERIRAVARAFQKDGFATLVADLLTADEQQFDARTGHFRVDAPLLASRVREVVDWALTEMPAAGLPVALFAGRTTAAACIDAARDIDLFALALIEPDFETVLDSLPGLETPTLLVFDRTPPFAHLSAIATPPAATVVMIPFANAEILAREAMQFFGAHLPLLVA